MKGSHSISEDGEKRLTAEDIRLANVSLLPEDSRPSISFITTALECGLTEIVGMSTGDLANAVEAVIETLIEKSTEASIRRAFTLLYPDTPLDSSVSATDLLSCIREKTQELQRRFPIGTRITFGNNNTQYTVLRYRERSVGVTAVVLIPNSERHIIHLMNANIADVVLDRDVVVRDAIRQRVREIACEMLQNESCDLKKTVGKIVTQIVTQQRTKEYLRDADVFSDVNIRRFIEDLKGTLY